MQVQKGFILPVVITAITIVVIAILGTAGYFVYKQYSAPKLTACTEEAKICPDGSAVGRTGPNCEFAACPAVVDPTADWKTYTNTKFGFQVNYPANWKLTDTSKDINTSDKGLVKNIGVTIESPLKYDLTGYEGVPTNYRILFYNPDYPDQKITLAEGFGSPDSKFGHQSWWNIEVSKSVKEATNEYKIGQQIMSTFKFTK